MPAVFSADPTCRLYDAEGALAQSVDLEPDTVPGRWVGSLTAAAGTYAAAIYDGEQLRGVFEQVVIPDQGVAVVRDTVNTSLQIDLEGLEVTAEVDEAALGAAVCSHPERRLTMPATSIAPDLSGDVIKRRRGDTWTVDLTGLGELSNRHEFWFTAKRSLGDSDLDAILQITESSGLLRGDTRGAPGLGQDPRFEPMPAERDQTKRTVVRVPSGLEKFENCSCQISGKMLQRGS